MTDDNDPPKNPFVRWKQHVDAHIGMTLHGLLGIPNMVSKNLNIRQDPSIGDGTSQNQPSSSASNAPASSSTSPTNANNNSNNNSNNGSGNGIDTHSRYTPSLPDPAVPAGPDDSLDGVDAAQLLAWHKFIYYSPYSPLKLQQQQHLHLLPPPVPQDVPFGADPFAFTYADAFEDLLRASCGRPLLDLADRSYRNLRYQMRYGSAIEPPYAFFHRMHTQRLLDAYFPRSPLAAADPAAGAAGEQKNGAAVDAAPDDVVRAVTALAERGDLWREQRAGEEEEDDDDAFKWDDDDDDDDDDDNEEEGYRNYGKGTENPWTRPPKSVAQSYGFGGSLFGELDRVFRVLGRIIDEDTGAAANRAKDNSDANNANVPKSAAEKAEAEAEDELYNAVRSAYANAEQSLSTLIKTFAGGFDTSSTSSSSASTADASSSSSSARDADNRQGETLQTTEEHVDAFGNRHVKTTVRRLDADGNEVARETRYTIRSQTAEEAAAAAAAAAAAKDRYNDSDDNSDSSTGGEKNSNSPPMPASNNSASSKASGWFWK
ncbi:MAG: hypothetical protein STHCBS139747_005479 [Sporothrix thermara]